MSTTCGRCSGALTEDVYRRIDEYASWCVCWGGLGFTQGTTWAFHVQNMGLNLRPIAP